MGGAIYWDYSEINDIDSNTFTSNSAEYYGPDYASYAQNLVQISSEEYTARRRQLDNTTVSGTDSLELDGLGSGSEIPTIYLALVDKFDQIVKSDSQSTATLEISSDNPDSDYSPVLNGEVSQLAENGMFEFTGITFIGEPTLTYSMLFHVMLYLYV